jgi:hypothetical protein
MRGHPTSTASDSPAPARFRRRLDGRDYREIERAMARTANLPALVTSILAGYLLVTRYRMITSAGKRSHMITGWYHRSKCLVSSYV